MDHLDINKKILWYLMATKKLIDAEESIIQERYLELTNIPKDSFENIRIETTEQGGTASIGAGMASLGGGSLLATDGRVKLNLLEQLKVSLENFNPNKKLSTYLKKMIIEKNFETMEVIKRSYIEKSYFYQILRGSKKPSRDKVLQIACSMNLSKEEIVRLLNIAGYGLSDEIKRDFIFIYCIENNFNTFEINDILLEFKEIPFF